MKRLPAALLTALLTFTAFSTPAFAFRKLRTDDVAITRCTYSAATTGVPSCTVLRTVEMAAGLSDTTVVFTFSGVPVPTSSMLGNGGYRAVATQTAPANVDSIPLIAKIVVTADTTFLGAATLDSLQFVLYAATFTPGTVNANGNYQPAPSFWKSVQVFRYTTAVGSHGRVECPIPYGYGFINPGAPTFTTAANWVGTSPIVSPLMSQQFYCVLNEKGSSASKVFPAAHVQLQYYVDE